MCDLPDTLLNTVDAVRNFCTDGPFPPKMQNPQTVSSKENDGCISKYSSYHVVDRHLFYTGFNCNTS